MRHLALCVILLPLLIGLAAFPAKGKVRVVTSITDLGSIASAVGGADVEVQTIARSSADVHRVEVLPSYMVRVSNAQLYLKVGLGLDQWADAIIDGSRNVHLKVLDCSIGIDVLEKPTGKVDASMGDVHASGNPHYWLDPRNGGIVARSVAKALGAIDPIHEAEFARRALEFAAAAEESHARGAAVAAGLQSREIITYHASWTYFTHAFGLDVASTIEPVPGIPPTGRHLQDLVDLIRERKVPVVIQEPYFSDDAGAFLARETGIHVAKVSPSCENVEPGSYLAHFDALYSALKSGN